MTKRKHLCIIHQTCGDKPCPVCTELKTSGGTVLDESLQGGSQPKNKAGSVPPAQPLSERKQ